MPMITSDIPYTIYPDREALGNAAGEAIAQSIRDSIAARGRVAVIFGSAPSQNETLATLGASPGIDWDRVTAFHLDEYVGASADAPYSFRRYLEDRLFTLARPGVFHGIRGESSDAEAECARYADLLRQVRPEIALLGIGENGHLAFNDPPCDFEDPQYVKVVRLAESCRCQQVHDGAFPALDQVPERAITLTLTAILRVPRLFVIVPAASKAAAVRAALESPVTPLCPASILRTHAQVRMYLDRDSASALTRDPL
jgi:glucosamine-6-phosphate deaminase